MIMAASSANLRANLNRLCSNNSQVGTMTMSKRRICDAYSVFVGRIPEDTTKHDLRKLFEGCGEIVDVVILQNGHAPHPYYGFVRYVEKAAVYKACDDLHSWKLKGSKLVVEIAQDTCDKILQEKTGGDSGSRRKQPPANRIANVISNTRLVESCSLLKQSIGKDAPVSTSHIFDDMKKQRYRYERCAVPWASMDSKNTNFFNISHRIMKSCREKCKSGDGEMLGKKRSDEFLSAFRTIMDEINSDNVLGESSDENSGTTETSSKLDDRSTKNSQISSARLSETPSKSNISVTKNSQKLNMDTHLKENKVVENEVVGIHGQMLDMKRSRRIVPYCEDDQSSSDSHSDMEQMVNYRSSVKRAVVSNTDLSKTHVKRLQPAYCSSSEDNALSNFDPAIIDVNLSKLKEIKRSEQMINNNDALEQLFNVKCRTETSDMVKTMARSSSFDSNTSSSSNDGRVDDSGVESDGRSSKRPLISQADLVNCKVIGRGGRCPSGSSSPPLAPQRFSLEKSVPKPRGRGRGVLGLDLSSI